MVKRKESSKDASEKRKKTEVDEKDSTSGDKEEGEKVPESFEKFQKELDDLASKTGKSVLLLEAIPGEEDEDEPPPSLEELRKLKKILIPKETNEKINSLMEELDEACEGLFMLWTSHSYIMYDFFRKEMKKVSPLLKKNKEEAFAHLLATTYVMKTIDHWYCDTDVPEEVTKIMKTNKQLWTKVLKEKDEEIGLGGENAREYLQSWLDEFRKEVKAVLED